MDVRRDHVGNIHVLRATMAEHELERDSSQDRQRKPALTHTGAVLADILRAHIRLLVQKPVRPALFRTSTQTHQRNQDHPNEGQTRVHPRRQA